MGRQSLHLILPGAVMVETLSKAVREGTVAMVQTPQVIAEPYPMVQEEKVDMEEMAAMGDRCRYAGYFYYL